MGCWGHKISESDTFADVYEQFFDEYNNGATAEAAAAAVRTQLGDYFVEYDDQYDAHFALALAQWETQSLEPTLLKKVEQFVESGADLKNREDRGADSKTLKSRASAQSSFLKNCSTHAHQRSDEDDRSSTFARKHLSRSRHPMARKYFRLARNTPTASTSIQAQV